MDLNARRALARLVLSLHPSLLHLASGGAPVRIAGRELDAQLQFLLHRAGRAPDLSTLAPAQARAASRRGFGQIAAPRAPGVSTRDLEIDAPWGALPCRAYRPARQNPAHPVFVYLHMGGGVIGDLETCDAFCSVLAAEALCPVLSVGYRLAPEHPFPAGLDDALHAFVWARAHAAEFGAPPGRAAVGGDSIGGNFAAVVAQELHARGAGPEVQLLIYPAVDFTSQTQSMIDFADVFPLRRTTLEWFVHCYAGSAADLSIPRLSPLLAPDLKGLAPALVITAGFDPLCDQGEVYAHRLTEAGVPCLYRCYESLAHAFTGFTGVVPAAETACLEIAGLLREAFEGRLPHDRRARPRAHA